MTREEKKQKKLDEKEAARLAKIDQLFESTKLTFCGKIFMFSIYASVISGIGCCIVSCIRAIFVTLLAIAKIDATKLDVFDGASGVCWTLFIISLLCVVGLAIAEIMNIADSDTSLLEKEDEE